MCVTTLLQSSSNGRLGSPSSATRPPELRFATIWVSAVGWPHTRPRPAGVGVGEDLGDAGGGPANPGRPGEPPGHAGPPRGVGDPPRTHVEGEVHADPAGEVEPVAGDVGDHDEPRPDV